MATTVHSTNPFISNDDDQQHQLEDEEEEEDEEVESDELDHTQIQDPQQRLLLNRHHHHQLLQHHFHTHHHLHHHHHQLALHPQDSITLASIEPQTPCGSTESETTTNAPNQAKGFIAVSETVIKAPSPTSSHTLHEDTSTEQEPGQQTPCIPLDSNSITQFELIDTNDALENLELHAESGAQELGNTGSGQPKSQPDYDHTQADANDQGDQENQDEEQEDDDEDDDEDEDEVEDEEEDDDEEDDDDDEDADDDEGDDEDAETSDESETDQVLEPSHISDLVHQQSSPLNHNCNTNSNNNNTHLPCHVEIQSHQYPNRHSTLHHVHYSTPPPQSSAPHHQQAQSQHLLHHHHIHSIPTTTAHEFHLHHHEEHTLHDTSNHPNLLHLQRTTSATTEIIPSVVAATNDSMHTSNCADLMDDNLICESSFCTDGSFRLATEQNNFIVNNYEDDGIHDNDAIQDENGDYEDEDDDEEDDEFESDDVDEDCIVNNNKLSFAQHPQLQTSNIHCLNQQRQPQDDNDVLDGERMLEVTRKLVRNTERDPDRDLRKQVLLKTAIKKLPHYMDYNHYNVDCMDQSMHAENISTQNYYDHHHQIQQHHHHLHHNLNHNHNMIDPQTQKSSFYHSVQPNAIQMSTTSLRMLDLNDDHEPDANSNVTQSSNKRSSSSTELSNHCPSLGSNNQYKKLRRKEIID